MGTACLQRSFVVIRGQIFPVRRFLLSPTCLELNSSSLVNISDTMFSVWGVTQAMAFFSSPDRKKNQAGGKRSEIICLLLLA